MTRVTDFWPASAVNATDERKRQILTLVQDRLKTLKDLPILTDYFFDEPTPDWMMVDDNKQLRKLDRSECVELLRQTRQALGDDELFTSESIQATLNRLLETTGQKPGILFSLIRLAVSWAPFSPALNDTIEALGKQTTIERLQRAIDAA
ncbi:MAG: hypothetical protein ABIR91_04315 [Candidatus Saccharimonadales bacterium]